MSTQTINISIVDDDRETRELLAFQLEQEDHFRILDLCDGALAAAETLPRNPPDIVLMDINMPEMNGIECLKALKDQMPDTDFIMLTVHDDAAFIFDALAAGAVGYLLKRSAGHMLIHAIHDAINGGSPMDIHIARKVVQHFRAPKQAPPNAEIQSLSDRERAIVELLAQGHITKEIADNLNIAESTVYTYIRRIYKKLHVNTRTEAVAKLSGMNY